MGDRDRRAGSTLFYRDKAEDWRTWLMHPVTQSCLLINSKLFSVKHTDETGQYVWQSLSLGAESPDQDHRKSLLLYWFVANIRK